jgi:NFU1 iron-sulfur cluster scaffold homolog, mitochondrial
METRKIPAVIYAESTPNPMAMKFVANRMLINGGASAEYMNRSEAKGSPLALELFNFPFIQSVFITGNFITIFRNDHATWDDIALELRVFLQDYLNDGKTVVSEMPENKTSSDVSEIADAGLAHSKTDSDSELRIVELLEEYIRPAVESDGGAVYFRKFENGIVTLALKGSCSGCPSASFTLKAGIEGLLKRMMPEVAEVVAEEV